MIKKCIKMEKLINECVTCKHKRSIIWPYCMSKIVKIFTILYSRSMNNLKIIIPNKPIKKHVPKDDKSNDYNNMNRLECSKRYKKFLKRKIILLFFVVGVMLGGHIAIIIV